MDIQIPDFSNYTFRASMIGSLMTEPKGKSFKDLHDEAKSELETSLLSKDKEVNTVQKLIDDTPEDKRKLKAFDALIERKAKIAKKHSDKIAKIKAKIEELKDKVHIPNLSATCISKLIEIYAFEKANVSREISSKYTRKGNKVEDQAISMLEELDGDFYIKNTDRLWNEFVQGECDILEEERTTDTKASWDYITFIRLVNDGLNIHYWWQGQVYMWLWGKKKHRIAYCLINTPDSIIEDEKKRLLYQMGSRFADDQIYADACQELEIGMKYDQIPIQERVIIMEFDYYENAIELLKERVGMWRQFLNDFAKADNERAYKNGGRIDIGEYIPFIDIINSNNSDQNLNEVDIESTKNIDEEKVKDAVIEILSNAVLSSEDLIKLKSAEEVISEIKDSKEEEKKLFLEDIDALARRVVFETMDQDDIETIKGFNTQSIDIFDKRVKEIIEENNSNTLAESDVLVESKNPQIDLETSIEEIKDEKSKALIGIENCKTEKEVLAFYKTIKSLYDTDITVRKAVDGRRAELKTNAQTTSVKPEAPKPVPVPVPKPATPPAPKKQEDPVYNPHPSLSQEDIDKEINDLGGEDNFKKWLIEKTNSINTGQEIQNLYRMYKLFADKDQTLVALMTARGISLRVPKNPNQ